jgi:hypothetical protein
MKHFKMLSPETKSQGNQASSQQNSIAKGKKCNTQEKFKAMTSAHAFVIYTRRKREEKKRKKNKRPMKAAFVFDAFWLLSFFHFLFRESNQQKMKRKERKEKNQTQKRKRRRNTNDTNSHGTLPPYFVPHFRVCRISQELGCMKNKS